MLTNRPVTLDYAVQVRLRSDPRQIVEYLSVKVEARGNPDKCTLVPRSTFSRDKQKTRVVVRDYNSFGTPRFRSLWHVRRYDSEISCVFTYFSQTELRTRSLEPFIC